MQFLTISRCLKTAEGRDGDLRPAEVQRARVLYAGGHIRQLWHRADVPGACILWEAESEEQLQAMVSSLPFVQAGLIEVSVIALCPYQGFGPESTE